MLANSFVYIKNIYYRRTKLCMNNQAVLLPKVMQSAGTVTMVMATTASALTGAGRNLPLYMVTYIENCGIKREG